MVDVKAGRGLGRGVSALGLPARRPHRRHRHRQEHGERDVRAISARASSTPTCWPARSWRRASPRWPTIVARVRRRTCCSPTAPRPQAPRRHRLRDPEQRKRLEAITHPAIRDALSSASCPSTRSRASRASSFWDAAAPDRDGRRTRRMDKLVVVFTDAADAARAAHGARRRCATAEARARIASQMPLADKAQARRLRDRQLGRRAPRPSAQVREVYRALLADLKPARGPRARARMSPRRNARAARARRPRRAGAPQASGAPSASTSSATTASAAPIVELVAPTRARPRRGDRARRGRADRSSSRRGRAARGAGGGRGSWPRGCAARFAGAARGDPPRRRAGFDYGALPRSAPDPGGPRPRRRATSRTAWASPS